MREFGLWLIGDKEKSFGTLLDLFLVQINVRSYMNG